MASQREKSDFVSCIIPSDLLDEAIAWVGDNLDPDEVFDEKKLSKWAENNGFTKEQ